jgi:hypothetical protein
MAVFWVLAPCNLEEVYCLIALMVEAASTSEMSANFRLYGATTQKTAICNRCIV